MVILQYSGFQGRLHVPSCKHNGAGIHVGIGVSVGFWFLEAIMMHGLFDLLGVGHPTCVPHEKSVFTLPSIGWEESIVKVYSILLSVVAGHILKWFPE